MILTGKKIRQEVLNNNIHIKPFDQNFINPNSYNYRLGGEILENQDAIIEARKKGTFKKIHLCDDGFTLLPHKLYLGSTLEEIGSDMYVTTLIGRSSIGRLGLFVQITADLGHQGSKNCWTLEFKVVQPLKIYPGMIIGQVCFWNVLGNQPKFYDGKYAQHLHPHPSKFYQEFNK
ncbi:dCTP deaminase, dUMP-forming [Alphaproteobacteria bacterium]